LIITIGVLLIITAVVLLNRSSARGIVQVGGESARTMSTASGVTVLDVRTPEEFREGHLKGAVLIPLAELSNRLGELESRREQPFLVYCRAGGRSAAACRVLRKSGFSRIANLQGGIDAWQGKGYPIAA
jgi:rhodanese-related sulfurtransferase